MALDGGWVDLRLEVPGRRRRRGPLEQRRLAQRALTRQLTIHGLGAPFSERDRLSSSVGIQDSNRRLWREALLQERGPQSSPLIDDYASWHSHKSRR